MTEQKNGEKKILIFEYVLCFNVIPSPRARIAFGTTYNLHGWLLSTAAFPTSARGSYGSATVFAFTSSSTTTQLLDVDEYYSFSSSLGLRFDEIS